MKNLSPTSGPYTGAGAADPGSLAATINFPAIPVTASRLSLLLNATGTPTGTFKLQTNLGDGTWIDTPNAGAEFTSQPAGGAYSILCNYSNVPGALWRLVYTRTSGTGTLTCWFAMGPA